MTTTLENPEDLVAALPALLGYVPQESYIILLLSEEGYVHQAMEMKLSAPEEAFIQLHQALDSATEAASMTVVTVGPQPGTDEYPLENILSMFPARFLSKIQEERQVPIYAIPRMRAGAPVLLVDLDGTPYYSGELPDWKETEAAANVVLHGASIEESEEAFKEMLSPRKDDVDYPGTDVRTWVGSGFETELRPSNDLITEFLLNQDERDWIVSLLSEYPSTVFAEFAAVARNSEGRARCEALAIAGLAAYCWGRGAHAKTALNMAIHEGEELDYVPVLASLAGSMLQHGIHPEKVKEVCNAFAKNPS